MHEISFSEAVSFLHHGVEGQKWGVRNGPPYPLDREAIAKDIKSKAKEVKKQANKETRNTDYYKGMRTASIVGQLLGGMVGNIVASSVYTLTQRNTESYKEYKEKVANQQKAKAQKKNAKELIKKFKDYSITDKELEGLMRDYEKANNALEKEKNK